jgi:RHS repeat-associated protein
MPAPSSKLYINAKYHLRVPSLPRRLHEWRRDRTATTISSGATVTAASSTNRMLFDGTYYYAYDADGNRTARWVDGNGYAEGSPQPRDTDITIYKWNEKGELTAVTSYPTYADYAASSSGSETTFAYNAFQQMVSTTPPGESPTTEYFIYDGANVALILNASGGVIERELCGPAVDQILASENGSTHVVNWMLADNQGTVRDVVQYSEATIAVDHVIYDSFGQVASQSSDEAADQSAFGFDGMWQGAVAATGLNYDNFRWYDAVNGVFASQDPLGFGGGQTNTEAFVGNSPTNFTDPMGLCDCGCPSGGGSDGQVGLMGFGGSGGSVPVYYSGTGEWNQTLIRIGLTVGVDPPPINSGDPVEDNARKELQGAAKKAEDNLEKNLGELEKAAQKAKQGAKAPVRNLADRAGLTHEWPRAMPNDTRGGIIQNTVKNGQIQKVLKNGNIKQFSGKVDFVIRNDGTLVTGEGHCVLNGQGNSVRFAGELRFKSGRLFDITNKSGHYPTPNDNLIRQGVFNYLKQLGISTKNVTFSAVVGS